MSSAARALRLFRRYVGDGRRASSALALLKGLAALVPVRRRFVLESIAASFPDKSPAWCRDVRRAVYEHFCRMMVEWMVALNDPSQVDRMVEYDPADLERLENYKRRGEGVAFATGHFGHWELFAAWFARHDLPLLAMARDANDSGFAQVIEDWRAELGVRTVIKEDGVAFLRRAVTLPRKGAMLGLLCDQDAGRNGLPVTFLGRPCTMVRGPATISLAAGVPLIPVFLVRLGPFRHRLVLMDELHPTAGTSREAQVEELTRATNRAIEGLVRVHPEQWFWFHRRWKSGERS